MTNPEAKAKFKDIMKAEIDRIPSHYDAEAEGEVYSDTYKVDEILKLNKVVCEALEKQVPKKVVTRMLYNEYWQRYYTIRVCPVCGVDTPIPRGLESWEFWCPDCGQAIDWSEEQSPEK